MENISFYVEDVTKGESGVAIWVNVETSSGKIAVSSIFIPQRFLPDLINKLDEQQ